jgi:hypothetical protein
MGGTRNVYKIDMGRFIRIGGLERPRREGI